MWGLRTWEDSGSRYRYHSLFGKFKGNIRGGLALPRPAVPEACLHGGVLAEPEGIEEIDRPGRDSGYCSMRLEP